MMKGWERLEEVINWTGLSTNAFAMELGLKRSENLYRIRREKNGISRKLVEIIIKRYPEINHVWLMTGEGDMFKNTKHPVAKSRTLHFYNSIEVGEDGEFVDPRPSESVETSMFEDSEFGLRVDTEAMAPVVPRGSLALLRKFDKNFIVYGQTYYVMMTEMNLFRTVRKGEQEGTVVLSSSTEGYDDITVSLDKIKTLYLVDYVVNKIV